MKEGESTSGKSEERREKVKELSEKWREDNGNKLREEKICNQCKPEKKRIIMGRKSEHVMGSMARKSEKERIKRKEIQIRSEVIRKEHLKII